MANFSNSDQLHNLHLVKEREGELNFNFKYKNLFFQASMPM